MIYELLDPKEIQTTVNDMVDLVVSSEEKDDILDDESNSSDSNRKENVSLKANILSNMGTEDSEKENLDTEMKDISISPEDKENIEKQIKTMSRKDLENLVLAKCIEGMVAHTNVGTLRSKVLQLYASKDKLFAKASGLQKQV